MSLQNDDENSKKGSESSSRCNNNDTATSREIAFCHSHLRMKITDKCKHHVKHANDNKGHSQWFPYSNQIICHLGVF